MPTLTTALDTAFTPAVGDFIVQATGAEALLERRNTSGAAWAGIGRFQGAMIVQNPVTGADYRMRAAVSGQNPTVQADQ